MVLNQATNKKNTTKYLKGPKKVLFQVSLNVYVLVTLTAYFQCSTMMRDEMGVGVLATEMVDFRSALGRVLCQEVKQSIWQEFSERKKEEELFTH